MTRIAVQKVNPETMTVDAIQDLFRNGLVPRREEWSLASGKSRKLDLVNHVLRVILQLGLVRDYVDEFDALLACQKSDGSWGEASDDDRHGVRNTCFGARNLIRAHRELGRPDYLEAAKRSILHVLGQQDPEGFFKDKVWGPRDATSSSMGLLHYALKEDLGEGSAKIHANARLALALGAAHLIRSQDEDGSWHDTSTYEAPVGPTSHLLPKMVLFAQGPAATLQRTIDYLVGCQGEDGSWDNQHVDHTCDAARALLLTYSVIPDPRLPEVLRKAIGWLAENTADDGLWGVRPGKPSNLIMTTDVLDAFSKYEAHRRAQDLRTFWQ
ncbi:MAG: terpene cyclase/mutase family protein [Acidobacteria bacterium]|nr:terpene cyclase/mutase family protein [Acidobacteriota bacterium]